MPHLCAGRRGSPFWFRIDRVRQHRWAGSPPKGRQTGGFSTERLPRDGDHSSRATTRPHLVPARPRLRCSGVRPDQLAQNAWMAGPCCRRQVSRPSMERLIREHGEGDRFLSVALDTELVRRAEIDARQQVPQTPHQFRPRWGQSPNFALRRGLFTPRPTPATTAKRDPGAGCGRAGARRCAGGCGRVEGRAACLPSIGTLV